MSSKKDNAKKYDNDDLNFIPLNIETPLQPNGTKFSLLFNINGFALTDGINNNSLVLPTPNVDPSISPLNMKPSIGIAPLTPYPENIPNLDSKTQISNDTSSNNDTSTDLEFPDELEDDFLYSYNEPRIDDNYLDSYVNPVDILRNFNFADDESDITRKGKYTDKDIDDIFASIEKNNVGILATMRAYRVPYPIAKIVIKKIIRISLDNYTK